MHDVPRPGSMPTIAERIRANAAFVGPGRLLTAALSIMLVAVGCWWLLKAPAPPVEASLPFTSGAGQITTIPSDPTERLDATPTTPVPSTIVVQAAGAVTAPGVYTLPSGARVHELIAAAGGVTSDADPGALGLAVVLMDGERVYVPRIGEFVPAAPSQAGRPTANGAASGPLDLNRASVDELDGLPGVGPATAQAIVAHRDRNGPFLSVEGLLDVRGIGPAKLDALRELVTV